MKNLTIILIAVCLILPIAGHSQNLNHYIELAAENNPGLKASYASFEASMQRIAQVNALPDPSLSFGIFIRSVETRVGPQRAKFSLSQMFPWFGTLAAKKEMTSAMAEAKYQVFLQTRNELYNEVKAAWYPLYEVKEILKFQKENIRILNSFKQLSTIGFKNGRNSMVDVIRADIMIENANTNIEILTLKQRPLLTRFNRILNRPDSISVNIQEALSLQEVDQNYRRDSLLSLHPLLTAYDLKLKSVASERLLVKKQGLPKFGVALDYVIVDPRTDMEVPGNGKDVLMPMATITLPIFRGKYKAALEETNFKQYELSTSRTALENKLVSMYDMEWYKLEKAKELVGLYDAQMLKSQQALDLLLHAYSNSGKDFEEVLRMQRELLTYKIAKTTATKDFYLALAEIDSLTAKSE